MNSLRPYERSQLTPIERLLRLEIAVWGQDGQNGLTGTTQALRQDIAELQPLTREWVWFKRLSPLVAVGLLNGLSLCSPQTVVGKVALAVAKAMGWAAVCG